MLGKVKVFVGDSYPSPNYWSNRIYEITGRGGFLLHPETIGLDEEFIAGKHYIAYKRPGNRAGWQVLQGLIDYWVTHDKEREQIRQQGFAHCGKHYTYTHRVKTLLEHIQTAIRISGGGAMAATPDVGP